MLIKSKGDADHPGKRRKLDAKAHIGYLVGYESTNIYRIWIPHKRKVISARDVIFNKDEVWDGRPVRLSPAEIQELNEAVEVVEVPQADEQEDIQLAKNLDFSNPITQQHNHEMENLEEEEQAKRDDLAWSQSQYPTPDPSEFSRETSEINAFLTNLVENQRMTLKQGSAESFKSACIADLANSADSAESEGVWSNQTSQPHHSHFHSHGDKPYSDINSSEADQETYIEPAILDELQNQQDQRFYDFRQNRIPSRIHTAFTAGTHRRDLPIEPLNYKHFTGHRFEKEFRQSMDEQLRQHREQFRSWDVVSSKEATGHQVLGCQWVFKYKTDKHNRLQKCKSRLVVCGNQQRQHDLPTRATTLAATSLRVLLALTAKFDLKTLQLDAVNAFVHAELLDEMVFMRMPPGYAEQGKVLKLNKTLYGLRRSPLLWQQKLTNEMKKAGYTEIPQEPCIVQKNGIICFFYVNDIVFAYQKEQRNEVKRTIAQLSESFTLEDKGELKWFLGLNVIRNRATQTMWLSQKAYISKICADLAPVPSEGRLPATPMEPAELLPLSADSNEEQPTEASRTLYQRKIGSFLYAGIATRPDIAFAVSRLSRFNQQPGKRHHEAADRVFHYLACTQDYCIRYGGDNSQDISSFLCASDASFGDNTIDRKSSQGYIIKLFGGLVAWRANKQDTVTTSSTEAELLAISQTAKESIYLSRLIKALNLTVPEPLTIECDNAQTIRLLVDESTKLQTKLRHVDIHSHWLRQEVQRGTIAVRWVPTKQMMADGLTKSLTHANHKDFVGMTGLEDQSELLSSIQKEEDLKDSLQSRNGPETSISFGYSNAT